MFAHLRPCITLTLPRWVWRKLTVILVPRKRSIAMDAKKKLSKLRELLQRHKLDAYIIPSGDAHQSEYIAEWDKRRAFISGFTGSSGTAVVTHDKALLWTDGRYYLQASKELDSTHWTLMKDGLPSTPSVANWLSDELTKGSRVGVDPLLTSLGYARQLRETFRDKGHELVEVASNLVDEVWGAGRPTDPCHPLLVLDHKYTGETHESKLSRVREALRKSGVDGMIVTALDEVAWLFNLRGRDVEYNPVFFAWAVVTASEARLFVAGPKVTAAVQRHLGAGVAVHGYDDVWVHLEALRSAGRKVLVDPGQCNLRIAGALGDVLVEKSSPLTHMKAVKNAAELDGMRQAHRRDGAALVSFLAWLDEAVAAGQALTEASVADKLAWFRSLQPDFVSPSFATISGSGPNGAIIHYKPEPATCAAVSGGQLYLCDSGGQYLDGTTDVTRTLHFGSPTAHERRCFTRVLQGHIALSRAVFPEGTPGPKLDALARLPLWRDGLDYRHGTGHGVGAFLNVHEGPHGISARLVPGSSVLTTPLVAGMVVTNEPGYYEDGAFGIRIENVMIVREAQTPHRFGGMQYFEFETITMAPIQTKLVDPTLLDTIELEWLNSYNARVWDSLSPLLDGKAKEYLYRETRPLFK